MKIKFIKEQNGDIITKLVSDTEKDFSYVELISNLFENTILEDSEFIDGISDIEKEIINSMISKINQAVTRKNNLQENGDNPNNIEQGENNQC